MGSDIQDEVGSVEPTASINAAVQGNDTYHPTMSLLCGIQCGPRAWDAEVYSQIAATHDAFGIDSYTEYKHVGRQPWNVSPGLSVLVLCCIKPLYCASAFGTQHQIAAQSCGSLHSSYPSTSQTLSCFCRSPVQVSIDGSPKYVAHDVDRLKSITAPGQPLIVTLQAVFLLVYECHPPAGPATDWPSCQQYRAITPEEAACEFFLAINHGATGRGRHNHLYLIRHLLVLHCFSRLVSRFVLIPLHRLDRLRAKCNLVCAGVLWFTAEGTGQTPQNTSKIALIDTQPALWAQFTLLATIMKNGLGMSTLRVSRCR